MLKPGYTFIVYVFAGFMSGLEVFKTAKSNLQQQIAVQER